MKSMSFTIRYYQLKCGHAPTATYLKRLGLQDDDQVLAVREGSPDEGAPLPPRQVVEE